MQHRTKFYIAKAIELKMQVRSAAARSAISAFAARPALPVRCAPETEKSVFARLNGRPNDEDMVAVLASGIDQQYRNRWDAVRRGVIMPLADSVIIRNEVPEADLNAAKRQPANSFKAFANPRADILADAKTACCVDFTNKKKVYFYDSLSVGVGKFGRFKVDFVTDDAVVAKALSQVLPKTPKSSIPQFHQQESTGVLLHSSTKDEQAGGLESYVMYDTKFAIARGVLPSISSLLDAFALMAASKLVASEVLVVKGDIHRDAKTGGVTLVLGEGSSEGAEVHGQKHAAWGAAGVTRLFEGAISDKDFSFQPLAGAPRSVLPQPKKIVFVSKKDGKTKQLEAESAKKLFVEKFAVGANDKTAPLFDKLVQAGKVELVSVE